MNKTHRNRLAILASHLRKVPQEKFNISHWIMSPGNGGRATNDLDVHECGTTACAVGHATTIPAFRKAGFVLERMGMGMLRPVFTDRHGNRLAAIPAIQAFFGISYTEVMHLFFNTSYRCDAPGPEDVAFRIETLLNNP